MANCRKHFKSASSKLKLATGFLILALFFHVVAFSTPNWTTVRLSMENASDVLMEGSDHGGLWQICSCYSDGFCICFGRHGDSGWVKFVQSMETFALIGYIISGIFSLVQLFSEQDRKLKRLNVFIIMSAGLCAALGAIFFGIRSHINYDDMAKLFDQLGADLHGHLDYSFYLCCLSTFLCLVVCTPLYMKDENSPVPTVTEEVPVIYNNQGQINIASQIQGYAYISDMGQQSAGVIPTIAQSPYGAPPAYTAADHSEIDDLPPSVFTDDIPPYKA